MSSPTHAICISKWPTWASRQTATIAIVIRPTYRRSEACSTAPALVLKLRLRQIKWPTSREVKPRLRDRLAAFSADYFGTYRELLSQTGRYRRREAEGSNRSYVDSRVSWIVAVTGRYIGYTDRWLKHSVWHSWWYDDLPRSA